MHRYLVLLPFLVAGAVQADPLKQSDKEALLQRLDKLSDSADAKIDSRFKVAVTAFRTAMASDTAALDLYLKCVEKVEYSDNGKKAQDFRDWQRKERATLESGGFREALRHQLSFLLMTMEAASTRGKPAGINGRLESEVDSIFADLDKLKDGKDVLSRSAIDSVFARAYDLKELKVEDWPASPLDLTTVFQRNLMPPQRTISRIPALRAEWAKYIKYEGLMVEKWQVGPPADDRRGNGRDHGGGGGGGNSGADYDKWMAEKYPELLWEMEIDVFKAGDQAGAATHMIADIEKYNSHAKAPTWIKQLRTLLTTSDAKGTGTGTPAASGTGTSTTPAPAPAAPSTPAPVADPETANTDTPAK